MNTTKIPVLQTIVGDFREVKRRTASFANAFRNAELETAETWLRAFTDWHDYCQT